MSYVKFSFIASAFLGAMIGLALTLGVPGQALAEMPQSSPAQTENPPQSPAQESTPPEAQPSLGEVARRLRAEQKQNQNQPVRVFTNDNVPKYCYSELR